MNTANNKNYMNYIWVDILRTIAIFAVVILHSTFPILYKFNNVPPLYWWVGNIYDSIVRMAVPLFFMSSGFLLLDKNESILFFFKKRINKVVIPLIAWSLFYIFWKIYYEKNTLWSLELLFNIILNPAYYHLWFLYAIIGIYLYVPFLRIIVQNSKRQHLYYFVVLWVIAVSLIPLICKYTFIKTNRIDLNMISGYGGYLVVGYLLAKYKISKKMLGPLLIIYFLALFITAYATFFLTKQNDGKFVADFYGYLTPNVIVISAISYILIKVLVEKFNINKSSITLNFIQKISSASLGIYCIHPVFLRLLHKGILGKPIDCLQGNPIYSIPITAILTFCISTLVVLIMQKIPIIKKIVP